VLAKLPCDERAPEEQDEKVREKLFSSWDFNGNGFLTLTEIHRGLLSLLGTLGSRAVAALQPAIVRAFHAARDSRTVGKASEYVAQGDEFRLLLVYLRHYIQLLALFDGIDTSDDRRVDLREFKGALPLLESWGVEVVNPQMEFASMDSDVGGQVLFDEFAGWALRRAGIDGHGLHRQHKLAKDTTDKKLKGSKSKKAATTAQDKQRARDLRELIDRLPCSKTEVDKRARGLLFSSFDADGIGVLFPEDVDVGLRALLRIEAGSPRSAPPGDLSELIELAFQAVTQMAHPISRSDFRLLLSYLKWYSSCGSPFVDASRRYKESKLPNKLPPSATFTRTRLDTKVDDGSRTRVNAGGAPEGMRSRVIEFPKPKKASASLPKLWNEAFVRKPWEYTNP